MALIDRGVCVYGDKVKHARAAGAVAVIICNNDDSAPESVAEFNAEGEIPFVMVSFADGGRHQASRQDSTQQAQETFKAYGMYSRTFSYSL